MTHARRGKTASVVAVIRELPALALLCVLSTAFSCSGAFASKPDIINPILQVAICTGVAEGNSDILFQVMVYNHERYENYHLRYQYLCERFGCERIAELFGFFPKFSILRGDSDIAQAGRDFAREHPAHAAKQLLAPWSPDVGWHADFPTDAACALLRAAGPEYAPLVDALRQQVSQLPPPSPYMDTSDGTPPERPPAWVLPAAVASAVVLLVLCFVAWRIIRH